MLRPFSAVCSLIFGSSHEQLLFYAVSCMARIQGEALTGATSCFSRLVLHQQPALRPSLPRGSRRRLLRQQSGTSRLRSRPSQP